MSVIEFLKKQKISADGRNITLTLEEFEDLFMEGTGGSGTPDNEALARSGMLLTNTSFVKAKDNSVDMGKLS